MSVAGGRAGGGRGRLARALIAVAIVAAIGGVFVARELLSDGGEDGLGLLDDRRVRVGQLAPDFALEDARDPEGTLRLSDLRGRTVVLNFWASWCPPCVREFPELTKADGERSDLIVLGVDFKEGAATAVGFADEHDGGFPIALDRDGSVTQRYGLRGLPGTFFIDREGIVRQVTLGPVFDELLPEGIALADAGTASDDSAPAGELVELGDDTGDVVVVNTTEQRLLLILNGAPQGPIDPGEERVIGQYLEGTTFGRIIARPSPEEPPLFNPWVTWEFLVERDFRIEIAEPPPS